MKDAHRARIERFERRFATREAAVAEHNINRPVQNLLRFTRLCDDRQATLRAEVYVAHGVQGMPAAALLAARHGGRYLCDVIEIPSFAQRAQPSRWHVTNIEFLNHAFEAYLRHAHGLLTISHALGELLLPINARVQVIPNYRNAEPLTVSNELRERCQLRDDERLVVVISTVTSGFEVVLQAIAKLPANIHLASIGKFAPPEYRNACMELAAELGLEARVHWFDPVPYAALASFASSGDVGLIVCDPAIPNNGISLPNRIFDYMAASLPMCSPPIPDVARLIRAWDMGVIVDEDSPAAWAASIEQVLTRQTDMRAHAGAAASAHVWESLETPLCDALGKPRSVCFVGIKHLCDNNRTLRMARSLAAQGIEVTLVSPAPRRASVTRVSDPGPGIRVETIPL